MARVFLDANFVIETVGLRKSQTEGMKLEGNDVFVAALTIHIMCYAFKIKVPDKRITKFANQTHVVNLSEKIVELSLLGPTSDFEDNVQLHSANSSKADFFVTNDEELLDMGIFGKTKIVNKI